MENNLFYLIFSQAHKNPFLDKFMIFGAEQLIFVTLITSLILALRGSLQEKRALLYILISIPLVVLMIKVIHLYYFTDRPFVSFDIKPLIDSFYGIASFPSRHTAAAAAIYFSFLINKSKWSPPFLIALVWVGIARVFVGVHFPIDILGSIILGGFSVIIVKKIIQKLF